MKKVKVTYDGIDITEYLLVTSLDRGLLPDLSHDQRKVGISDGYRHISTSIGKKTISMGFAVITDVVKKRRKLASILMKRETAQLIFDDEPDKYWLAVPTGDISVDDIVRFGKGTITWIVPDGVSHAVAPRYFTNVISTDTSNLILDPEFAKKDKYLKQWVSLSSEQYEESNVVGADFTDTNTIAGKGETTLGGMFIFQNPVNAGRSLPELAKGNPISARVMVKIKTLVPDDNDGTKSVCAAVQELEWNGGKVLATHKLTPTSVTEGEWQELKIEGLPVTNSAAKALNFLFCISKGASAEFAKPQLQVSDTLGPYGVPATELSDYLAITNPGTYRAWPIFRAKITGDNGLVGILGEDNAVLQFGNPDELDTTSGKKTDKVINFDMVNPDARMMVNDPRCIPVYPNYLGDSSNPNLQAGSWNWTADKETVAPVWPNNPLDTWGGPSIYYEIPKNNENLDTGDFTFRNRFNFKPTKEAAGRVTFGLQNTEGAVLSMVIRDSNRGREELIVEYQFKRKVLKSVNLDRKQWTGNFWESSIKKTAGTKVEFKFSKWKAFSGEGIVAAKTDIFNVDLPELAEIPIEAGHVWMVRVGKGNPPVKNNPVVNWTDCKFYWDNETTTTDIPNIFDDGDLIEIDTWQRKIFVNGIENNWLHALGNTWERFAVEPGTTTIMPVASSWAVPFEFEVELRGAYIG